MNVLDDTIVFFGAVLVITIMTSIPIIVVMGIEKFLMRVIAKEKKKMNRKIMFGDDRYGYD